MKFSALVSTSALLGLTLTAGLAFAQGMGGMGGQMQMPPSPQGGQQPAQQGGMGMMGGG